MKNNGRGGNKRIKEESTGGQRGAEGGGMWLNSRAVPNRHKTLGSIHNTALPTKQRRRRRRGKDEFDANMERAEERRSQHERQRSSSSGTPLLCHTSHHRTPNTGGFPIVFLIHH